MSKSVERFTAGSQVLWGYGQGEWVRYSDYTQLQSRLAQVEQERDGANERAKEAQSNVEHLTSVIFANRHVHHFRSRAIQLCKDQAARYKALADDSLPNDQTAARTAAIAAALNTLATELEKL